MEHPPSSCLICPYRRSVYCTRLSDSIVINRDIVFKIGCSYEDSWSSHSLYPLHWCNNKESEDEPSWCGVCQCKNFRTTYYFCNECDRSYHKECVESSQLIKSPLHPKHHLQLLSYYSIIPPYLDLSCSYCGSSVVGSRLFYYCTICELSLDPVCAIRPSFLNYPKRHEHTLNHFPRKTVLICDVCGLVDSKSLIYLCFQCGFVVHTKCIYLPFIIRISRHDHRLSFTYTPPSILSCGVCQQKVDENYGKYYCTKGCTYVVHSKCATRRDVWDRKELEEVPEEEEEKEYKDLKSFQLLDDGSLQHFSHSHHMRFEKWTTGILYDENKRCQACVLPVYGDDVYSCVDSQCDFVLHEVCANLPRTKHYMAYPYQFILQVNDTKTCFFCGCCDRFLCGFRYVYSKGGESISLDVRCAAISEPYNHEFHPHPLFLSNELGKYKPCSICRKQSIQTLNCIKCDFCLCFYCATLPYKVRYEHDEHFITFSYDENASHNWCDICEEVLDSYKWFYTCNECGVAFHIKCLLGKCAIYVKPAQNLWFGCQEFNIILINGLTRPICTECERHCKDKLMLQLCEDTEIIYCYRHWEVAIRSVRDWMARGGILELHYLVDISKITRKSKRYSVCRF